MKIRPEPGRKFERLACRYKYLRWQTLASPASPQGTSPLWTVPVMCVMGVCVHTHSDHCHIRHHPCRVSPRTRAFRPCHTQNTLVALLSTHTDWVCILASLHLLCESIENCSHSLFALFLCHTPSPWRELRVWIGQLTRDRGLIFEASRHVALVVDLMRIKI